MRKLYLSTTVIFWLLVSAFWAGSLWLPPAEESVAVAAEKVIAPERTGQARIARQLLDGDSRPRSMMSAPICPSIRRVPSVVLPWCGKEATEAYDTKTKGRPHSAYADELLARYRIGSLAANKP
jgi:hypothetical protein